MPRANRHYIPGYLWHITHRCHKKEFLLKFARDRRRWIEWLYEAKKRHGLCILNYMVTSNHIHPLVADNGKRDTIPNSIQLLAGRTGQEYNQRKNRKGAYWEDRYHATAVASDSHLFECMLYIDLNMVRAGVVNHPKEWLFCGYNEIQKPKQRYSLIDYEKLIFYLQRKDFGDLQVSCREAVEGRLSQGIPLRDEKWSKSIAVGTKAFVEAIVKKLGIRAKGRKVIREAKSYMLREPAVAYGVNFAPENDILSFDNSYVWNDIH